MGGGGGAGGLPIPLGGDSSRCDGGRGGTGVREGGVGDLDLPDPSTVSSYSTIRFSFLGSILFAAGGGAGSLALGGRGGNDGPGDDSFGGRGGTGEWPGTGRGGRVLLAEAVDEEGEGKGRC